MTKSQEIKILQSFIRSLPQDSYIRPWLSQVVGEVECDIRSDFLPSPTLANARAQAQAILTEAQAQADKLIEAANAKAAKIEKEAESYRRGIADAIHQAERAIYAY